MSSLRTATNQFRGINPLLNSYLQVDGDWDNFHLRHITDLIDFLNRDLADIGYVAKLERSLQSRKEDDYMRSLGFDIVVNAPVPLVSDREAGQERITLPLQELLAMDEEEVDTYRAIGIYRKSGTGAGNQIVAWIELLSPSNKPGGRHHQIYQEKRKVILQSGLVFVEIDYLHHQLPTIAVPAYPDHAGSSPYRILMINPRPHWLDAVGQVYPFHVDDPLPTLDIPLGVEDMLHFDFNAPYQHTIADLISPESVDYAALPAAWGRYSKDDKARILSRLLALRSDGIVETPAAVKQLSLDEAWRLWHE